VIWVRLGIDLGILAFAIWTRRRTRNGPSATGVLALALPTVSLAVLFVLAGLSSPHVHRASPAGVGLADGGCIAAGALCWMGARLALRLRSIWRLLLVGYGIAVGLFFVGEAIAVAVLNL
jgi:hypothetical protein